LIDGKNCSRSLSEEQVTAPQFDDNWSVKDVMNHLWGWQQISIARMEAGQQDRGPELPKWVTELGAIWEESADQTNAQIYKNFHELPSSDVYQNWRDGYLHFIELGKSISEKDLLDGDRFSWLKGYSLAFILIASYEHHEEHYEKLQRWLTES
jgi:hypothetical protein